MIDKVKIGGTVYEINKTSQAIVSHENKVLLGRIVYSMSRIEIFDGLLDDMPVKEQSQEVTMWHEILHAIAVDRKLDFGEDEEKVIESLARALHALIKDNPDLFREMGEEKKQYYNKNTEKIL
jgi:hypothetical protein